MALEASSRNLQYVYAVIGGVPKQEWDVYGIDGNAVHTVTDGAVSAVVSTVSRSRIRPERRHLAAHQQVLKRLMAETSLLPLRFGTIADDAKAVRRLLFLHQERFLTQLRRVAGKIEMGLQVSWEVPNVFEYFIAREPELRRLRDRYFGAEGRCTQKDRIEIGQLFDQLLNEEREACTRRVENALVRSCTEIKRNACRNEREVMNLACLVERATAEEFAAAVAEAARLFDDSFAFKQSGPRAPHNFVDLDLAA
jgi:Gas vesicle synthesis protein GvpL/GvpF